MSWKVYYSAAADEDLGAIYEYIAFTLREPLTAGEQVKRIMDAIDKLDTMPKKFHEYPKEPWHSMGLRHFAVDNFTVYYLLNEETEQVRISRIMYGGRSIDERLKEKEL